MAESERDVDDGMQEALPRISMPIAAVAAVQQGRRHVPWSAPMGFEKYGRDTLIEATKHTLLEPKPCAATWFRELLAAHRSAQFVHHCRKLCDFDRLYHSETAELKAAAGGLRSDDSLPPRKLAIWLVVHENSVHAPMADAALDAIAHWARFVVGGVGGAGGAGGLCAEEEKAYVANTIRLSVVNGDCGAELNRRLQSTLKTSTSISGDSRHFEAGACWSVIVRWATATAATTLVGSGDGGGGGASCYTLHSARRVDHAAAPSGADSLLHALQQAVVQLCGVHDIPFPAALVRAVTTRVPMRAFSAGLNAVDAAFDALATRPPCSVLSERAAAPTAPPLEALGVAIRMSERSRGVAGIVANTAFHGALLGFGGAKEGVTPFLQSCRSAGRGFRVPIGEVEEGLGLHVCAINANEVFLRSLVTLYGPEGRPGERIHPWPHAPFGAWMWAECVAIRSLDEHLLQVFDVRACTKASILPREAALADACRAQLALASNFFSSVQDGAASAPVGRGGGVAEAARLTREGGADVGVGLDKPSLEFIPSLGIDKGGENEANEDVFVASGLSLQIDLSSHRTTVGDALAVMIARPEARTVTAALLGVASERGINVSLAQAFDVFAERMRVHQQADAAEKLAERNNKRVLEFVLALHESEASSPPPKRPCASVASKVWVRRLLAATGVVTATTVVLHRGAKEDKVRKVVAILRDLINCHDDGGKERPQPQRDDEKMESADTMGEEDDDKESLAVDSEYLLLRRACAEAKSPEDWTGRVETAIARALGAVIMYNAVPNTDAIFVLSSSTKGKDGVCVHRVALEPALVSSSIDELSRAASPRVVVLQHTDGFKTHITTTRRGAPPQ